jgi:hypothetical protein
MSCPANSEGSIIVYLLSMSQVNHGDSSLLIDHKIGSLYITVNESILMKLLQDQPDLGDNNKSEFRVEGLHHLQQFVKRQSVNWL